MLKLSYISDLCWGSIEVTTKDVMDMSVKRRILTIRLMEKATSFPNYADEIGLKINFINSTKEKEIRYTQGEKENGYNEKREND